MTINTKITALDMGKGSSDFRFFSRVANFLLPRKNKAHLAVFLLTILLIPSALQALEPIDLEAYDIDAEEIIAEEFVNQELSTSSEIFAFLVTVRDPVFVGTGVIPEERILENGNFDYTKLPQSEEFINNSEALQGIKNPKGGVLNLTILNGKIDSIGIQTGKLINPIIRTHTIQSPESAQLSFLLNKAADHITLNTTEKTIEILINIEHNQNVKKIDDF